jgi:hypothetical protein
MTPRIGLIVMEKKFLSVFVKYGIFTKKGGNMIVERTPNEILLKISPNIDKFAMERLLEYIEYLEMTSDVKGKQGDADKLADELNATWWTKNRDKFIK